MKFSDLITLMRLRQWPKQVIIGLPLLSLGANINVQVFLEVILAMLTFTFAASSIYIFNDLQDEVEDRKDHIKWNRPIASGKISKGIATKVQYVCGSFSLLLGYLMLPMNAGHVISVYLIINFVYSKYRLKNHRIVGVACVATGFPLRYVMGSFVAQIDISWWAVVMISQIALALLSGKRYQTSIRSNENFMSENYSRESIFWLFSLAIYAVIFVILYSAFTTEELIQNTWGKESLLISTVLVGLGLARFLEIVVATDSYRREDSTETITKDPLLAVIVLLWVITLFLGRIATN